MRNRIILLALALSVTATGAFATQSVSFADGRATVPLPDSFSARSEGGDLVADFGKHQDHRLELTLLRVLAGDENTAVQFVESQGKKKGITVTRAPGRAALMEAGEQEKRGEVTFQSVHWQIAVGRCLFTMTITAPLPMSSELDEFLGDPLNRIVEELACKPASP